MATILLTDGQQRKTLSAARSLGRAGHRVLVAEVTRFATARYSRYVVEGFVCPDPGGRPDAFQAWLKATVARHGVDCVMPMDDASTEAVIAIATELGCRSLVPPAAAFAVARDKAATVALAGAAGLRAPRTAPDPDTALAAGVGWPLVVKARHGSGSRGIRPVATETELRAVYAEISQADPAPLVQEYIPPGRKFDVCLLYDADGRLSASFVQEELRGYPLWGGPSTLQESLHRPDLIDLAARLLAPLQWRGPVEVEFLEDPRTGEPVLMEINPRFWASLDLAVACSVDFPRWTADLALGRTPQLADGYPDGRRCRWLLPGDILHFLANPDRLHMNPGFFQTMDSRTHDDILSWHDPLPAVGFFLAFLRYAFDLRMWRMVIRW